MWVCVGCERRERVGWVALQACEHTNTQNDDNYKLHTTRTQNRTRLHCSMTHVDARDAVADDVQEAQQHRRAQAALVQRLHQRVHVDLAVVACI